jgi:hypothetical protein
MNFVGALMSGGFENPKYAARFDAALAKKATGCATAASIGKLPSAVATFEILEKNCEYTCFCAFVSSFMLD